MSDMDRTDDGVFLQQVLGNLLKVSEAGQALGSSVERMAGHGQRQDALVQSARNDSGRNRQMAEGLSGKAAGLADKARDARDAGARGKEQVDQVFQRLGTLFDQVSASSRFLENLGDGVKRMQQLVQRIDDISGLLKILGINASIEAARAGEAGRGFAVVAKEVQNLADRAREAVGDVDSIIGDVSRQMGGVDQALGLAARSVTENRELGNRLLGELGTVTGLNRTLGEQSSALSREIDELASFARDMDAVARDLGDINNGVQEDVAETSRTSAGLGAVVKDTLALIGGRRMAFHEGCENDLRSLAVRLDAERDRGLKEPSRIRSFLESCFPAHPHFTLLYLMDPRGRQVHDNAVPPGQKGLQDQGGTGADRSNRPYVTGLRALRPVTGPDGRTRPPVYMSGVYLSSANHQLCLTGSIALADGSVLAADMGIKDLISAGCRD